MPVDISIFREVSRKSRKECLSEVGKERFGFDEEHELLKYKYLSFERLSKKEWEQCQRCIKCKGMPYNYSDWRGEIREKYIAYNMTELMEFKRYLALCAGKRKIFISTRNREIEINMYKDYQKVIDEIIEFKKR